MTQFEIRWARVEYQPDLKRPTAPIPLGVILFYKSPDILGVVVVGREPVRGSVPFELMKVGPLGASQLFGWVGALSQDAGQAQMDTPDAFGALSTRWRWNLYVTDPETKNISIPEGYGRGESSLRQTLLRVGKELYESYVKEPFLIPQFLAPNTAGRFPIGGQRKEWLPREVESLTLVPS